MDEPRRHWWWSDALYSNGSPTFSRFLARRPLLGSAILSLVVMLLFAQANHFVWWKDLLAFLAPFASFYLVGTTNRGFLNRGGKYRDGGGWSKQDR